MKLREGIATIAIGRAITLDVSRLERATYAKPVEAENVHANEIGRLESA